MDSAQAGFRFQLEAAGVQSSQAMPIPRQACHPAGLAFRCADDVGRNRGVVVDGHGDGGLRFGCPGRGRTAEQGHAGGRQQGEAARRRGKPGGVEFQDREFLAVGVRPFPGRNGCDGCGESSLRSYSAPAGGSCCALHRGSVRLSAEFGRRTTRGRVLSVHA